MPNYIERIQADAAAKRAAIEDSYRKSPPSVNFDADAETSRRKHAAFETGKQVLAATGIQQALKDIAYTGKDYDWTHSILDVGNGLQGAATLVLIKNDGKSVQVTYTENGNLEILSAVGTEARTIAPGAGALLRGARVQVLTSDQIQNSDVVAAALEKAVQNPVYRARREPTIINNGPGY